jgi:hypothetical protein
MTMQTKKPSPPDIPAVADPPRQEAIDRLTGLLPEEQLQDALGGLSPEQITGPGGLVTLAARAITARVDPQDGQDRARGGRDQDSLRPGGHV